MGITTGEKKTEKKSKMEYVNLDRKYLNLFENILEDVGIKTGKVTENKDGLFDIKCVCGERNMFLFAAHLYAKRIKEIKQLETMAQI